MHRSSRSPAVRLCGAKKHLAQGGQAAQAAACRQDARHIPSETPPQCLCMLLSETHSFSSDLQGMADLCMHGGSATAFNAVVFGPQCTWLENCAIRDLTTYLTPAQRPINLPAMSHTVFQGSFCTAGRQKAIMPSHAAKATSSDPVRALSGCQWELQAEASQWCRQLCSQAVRT